MQSSGSTQSSTGFSFGAPLTPSLFTFPSTVNNATQIPGSFFFGVPPTQAVNNISPTYRTTPIIDATERHVVQQTAITAMNEYENKSFEELRLESYIASKKVVQWDNKLDIRLFEPLKDFTDVTLKTNDDKELHFYKVMLIQFEFYNMMLTSGMAEGNYENKRISIDCSFDVGKVILNYIYYKYRNMGEIAIPADLAIGIYRFTEQHMMPDLKEKCKPVIINQVPYSGDLFRLARIHKPEFLTEDLLRDKYLSLCRSGKFEASNFTKDDFDFDFWVSVGKGTRIIELSAYCLRFANLVDDETAKTLISMITNVHSMSPEMYTHLSTHLERGDRCRWLASRVFELLANGGNQTHFGINNTAFI